MLLDMARRTSSTSLVLAPFLILTRCPVAHPLHPHLPLWCPLPRLQGLSMLIARLEQPGGALSSPIQAEASALAGHLLFLLPCLAAPLGAAFLASRLAPSLPVLLGGAAGSLAWLGIGGLAGLVLSGRATPLPALGCAVGGACLSAMMLTATKKSAGEEDEEKEEDDEEGGCLESGVAKHQHQQGPEQRHHLQPGWLGAVSAGARHRCLEVASLQLRNQLTWTGGRLCIQSPAHTVSLTAELNPLGSTLVVPCASLPVQPGAADAHHSSHAWHHAPHSNGIAHVEGLPIRVSQGPGGSGLQGAGLSGGTRLGVGMRWLELCLQECDKELCLCRSMPATALQLIFISICP